MPAESLDADNINTLGECQDSSVTPIARQDPHTHGVKKSRSTAPKVKTMMTITISIALLGASIAYANILQGRAVNAALPPQSVVCCL